jgi:hypothetical protein
MSEQSLEYFTELYNVFSEMLVQLPADIINVKKIYQIMLNEMNKCIITLKNKYNTDLFIKLILYSELLFVIFASASIEKRIQGSVTNAAELLKNARYYFETEYTFRNIPQTNHLFPINRQINELLTNLQYPSPVLYKLLLETLAISTNMILNLLQFKEIEHPTKGTKITTELYEFLTEKQSNMHIQLAGVRHTNLLDVFNSYNAKKVACFNSFSYKSKYTYIYEFSHINRTDLPDKIFDLQQKLEMTSDTNTRQNLYNEIQKLRKILKPTVYIKYLTEEVLDYTNKYIEIKQNLSTSSEKNKFYETNIDKNDIVCVIKDDFGYLPLSFDGHLIVQTIPEPLNETNISGTTKIII